MKQNNILLYYTLSFTAFLIERLGNKVRGIDKIILYGSVAKGEATEESDVDIFVDTKQKIKKDIDKILEEFYKSKVFLKFKLNGIENEISIKAGELKSWKELHRSIASTGIILWGAFEANEKLIGTKQKTIFYWDKIEKNRGAFLNKLYGFSVRKKRYIGLLEKWGGKTIGKSCIIIPKKFEREIIELIKKYKVSAKKIDVLALE